MDSRHKTKELEIELIPEEDGSYGIACDALRVYSSGKTKTEAKKNFDDALELYFSHVRNKAKRALASRAGA